MQSDQFIALGQLRTTAQVAKCCQAMDRLPAVLSADKPQIRDIPLGAYYRDPEMRSIQVQLSSLSKADWEKLRELARKVKP